MKKRASTSPTFYGKLTSQKHIGLDGVVTYSTRPGLHGAIVCSHAGKPDQTVMLIRNPNGTIRLWNVTAKREQDTFVHADNCCAEQLHKTIELFSKPRRVIRDRD